MIARRLSDPRSAVALAVISVLLSALPRVLLAAGSLPDPVRPFVWTDLILLYQERLHRDALPYFGAFFEYPPLVGYISGALVRIVPSAAAFVLGWAIVCAAAAGIVAFLIGREAGPGPALLWALSPQLLLYGAMNFDVLAVTCLVTAIALARSQRPVLAMTALAIGTLAKGFPALAVPVEVQRLWQRRGTRPAVIAVTVFALLTLAVALPAILAPYGLLASAVYLGMLTNFDSVWGLALAGLEGLRVPGARDLVLVASTFGAIAMYMWALRRARGRALASGAALALIAVLLWSRLYSPQYSLWLVPFFALRALPLRAFAVLCIADVVVFATVYPLTLVRWGPDDGLAGALFGALAFGVVLRHAALVMAWSRPSPA